MKLLCIILLLIIGSNGLFAQQLSYKKGKFYHVNQDYSIAEFGNVLNMDETFQAKYERIQSIDNAKKVWTTLTMVSVIGTGVGILGISKFGRDGGPIIGVTGQIFSGVLLLFSIPTALVSTTGLIISSIKRKNRINAFVDGYNNGSFESTEVELGIQFNTSGVGLVYRF